MTGSGISIRWKVALSVSLLLIAVAGAVAVALIRYERFFLAKEGEKRVRALAENLAVNARDPLLAGNDLRLAPITQSVMSDEDALHAFVVDHRQRVAYHPTGSLIGANYPEGIPSSPGTALEASVPIHVEGTRVGTAVVALDTEFIDEAMRTTTLGLMLPLTVGTLVGVIGIFFLTGYHVKRIEALEAAIQAVAGGDMLAQAPVSGNDEVSRLAEHFNRMVNQLQGARDKIEQGFMETVGALAAAIEAKDPYTRGHCDRVAKISRAIAIRIGVEESRLKDLELAALLHDVGKIGVKASILTKTGRLSDSELASMKQHPEIGARILSSLSSLGEVGDSVRHHHEFFDGSGYPDGLAGSEIPLPARIISIVDAYDAMTTTRPYSSALTHEEAIHRIVSEKGRQFDPQLVEAFLAVNREGLLSPAENALAEAEVA